MARKRDPTKPIKKRAKLSNPSEINAEIARIYRLLDNGQVSPAVAARKVEVLKVLRSGMADPVETAAFPHPGFAIHPLASGTFLTQEAMDYLKATNQLPPGALVELLPIDPAGSTTIADKMLDAPSRTASDNSVVEFVPRTEKERRLLAELEALTPEQLLERAKQEGFVDADGNRIG